MIVQMRANALARFRWSFYDGAAVKVLGIDLERFRAADLAAGIWNGPPFTAGSDGVYPFSASDMSALRYHASTGVGQAESEDCHLEQGEEG